MIKKTLLVTLSVLIFAGTTLAFAPALADAGISTCEKLIAQLRQEEELQARLLQQRAHLLAKMNAQGIALHGAAAAPPPHPLSLSNITCPAPQEEQEADDAPPAVLRPAAAAAAAPSVAPKPETQNPPATTVAAPVIPLQAAPVIPAAAPVAAKPAGAPVVVPAAPTVKEAAATPAVKPVATPDTKPASVLDTKPAAALDTKPAAALDTKLAAAPAVIAGPAPIPATFTLLIDNTGTMNSKQALATPPLEAALKAAATLSQSGTDVTAAFWNGNALYPATIKGASVDALMKQAADAASPSLPMQDYFEKTITAADKAHFILISDGSMLAAPGSLINFDNLSSELLALLNKHTKITFDFLVVKYPRNDLSLFERVKQFFFPTPEVQIGTPALVESVADRLQGVHPGQSSSQTVSDENLRDPLNKMIGIYKSISATTPVLSPPPK